MQHTICSSGRPIETLRYLKTFYPFLRCGFHMASEAAFPPPKCLPDHPSQQVLISAMNIL